MDAPNPAPAPLIVDRLCLRVDAFMYPIYEDV